MRLTTKGRYAVTAVLDLSFHQHEGPVSLADISNRQGISLSYLEQLFAKLRSKGLVRGVRGPGGGYRLARSAGEISIAQIVAAINDMEDAGSEVSTQQAGENPKAEVLNAMWDDLSGQIYQFLDGITLDQFAKEESKTGKLSKTGSTVSEVDEHQTAVG